MAERLRALIAALACVLAPSARADAGLVQDPAKPQDPAQAEPATPPAQEPQRDPEQEAPATHPNAQLPPPVTTPEDPTAQGNAAQPPPELDRDAKEAPKPRATQAPLVTKIYVVGARRYKEAELVSALGQKVGAPLDPIVVQNGLRALQSSFHVRAQVDQRPADGGVELRLSVEEMNVDLEPRFVGNAEIDLETLRKWGLLEERSELYLYQAERVRHRLLEGYRKEGYHFVEIDVVRRGTDTGELPPGERPDVIFEIREGPCVRVKDFVVQGADTLPERGMWFWRDGLTKLADVQLGGPWLFNWLGAKFVESTLQADVIAMREVYRDRGYLDAVVELLPLEFSSDKQGVVIRVIVDEGKRYQITKFSVRAVTRRFDAATQDFVEEPAELLLPESELLPLCKLRVGTAYERILQEGDANRLRDHYGKFGYLSHPSLGETSFEFLDPELTFDPKSRTVEVVYKIAQGEKRWVREVAFAGARHTRDRVVRREIDLLPGDVADITKIKRSLNRLYSTAYFSDEMSPLDHRDPTFTIKRSPDPRWIDLEYQVEEGRVINFQIQGGVDSNNGLFGRVTLSMRNFDAADPPESLWTLFSDVYDKTAFHGAGQRIDLEVSPGTVVNSYRLRFLEPDLFRSHFDRYSLDMELRRSIRPYRAYDEDREERRIRIGREFGRELTLFVGYTNQDVEVSDIEASLVTIPDPGEFTIPEGIYDVEGENRLSGGLFDVQYRDVDNWLDPREGFTGTWRNGLFGGPLGGDWQYARSELDVDLFVPIGEDVDEVRPSFHIGFGLGVADGFGDSDETPHTERFFLGGTRTLRGFALRGVGPNVGREAIGGESSIDGTIEFRYPLYTQTQRGTYKKIETFRGLLFLDAGILDPDPYSLDIDELRATLGFGVGLVQPIPIQVNFGFPIETGSGDRRQVFSFSILSLWF